MIARLLEISWGCGPWVVSREWHGFTNTMQVTGISSNGYGCGSGFPYLWAAKWAKNEPKQLSIEWVMSKTVNWECFDHNPLNSWPLYCTTQALDWYPLHSDRTPHTWIMTSLNICDMAVCDPWHSLLPSDNGLLTSNLLPSELTYLQATSSADFHKLSHHPCISWYWPNLLSLSLWGEGGECGRKERQ